VEYYGHSQVGVGILSLPSRVPHDLHMLRFGLCFLRGKALGWGTFGKCRVGLSYCPVLKLLFAGMPPSPGLSGANMGQECRQL